MSEFPLVWATAFAQWTSRRSFVEAGAIVLLRLEALVDVDLGV